MTDAPKAVRYRWINYGGWPASGKRRTAWHPATPGNLARVARAMQIPGEKILVEYTDGSSVTYTRTADVGVTIK